MQFEVGRTGDFEWESPVSLDVIPDPDQARAVQDLLARGIAHASCCAELDGEAGWKRYLLMLETAGGRQVIGTLSGALVKDLRSIAKAMGGTGLAPAFIHHLVVYGVCTVAVDPDNHKALDGLHDEFRATGLFLAPLVKGFVTTKLK
jgi:hypothetical protein